MATDVNVIYPEATRLVRRIEHALRQLEDGVVAPGAGTGAGYGAGGGPGASGAWGGPGGRGGASHPGGAGAGAADPELAIGQLLSSVSQDLNALGHHVKSLQGSVGRQAPHRRDLWKS